MATITDQSRAKIRTSMGDMELEFLNNKAPRTVENFVKLVRQGFYDGLTFHRIMKDFMIQGGCPKGDGTGGPGYTIRPEFNDTPHVKGIVSMARSNDPHSAGSQFFICCDDARYLDSRYTAFARVVDGIEVLEKIADVPTHMENRFKEKSTPRDPVYINGVDLTDVEFDEEEAAAAAAPAPEKAAPETKSEKEPASGKSTQAEEASADEPAEASAAEATESAEKPSGGKKSARSRKAPRRKSASKSTKSEAAQEEKAAGDGEPAPKKTRRTRRKTSKPKNKD